MAKIGRNDPCPCGSGRKYKKCCMEKDLAEKRAAKAAAEPKTRILSPRKQFQQRSSEILDLIEETTNLALQNKNMEACETGWAAWELIRTKLTPEIRSVEDLEQKLFLGFGTFFNWSQDFEMYLGNAGIEEPRFHEKRIQYCREFLEAFPDESPLIRENMGRAVGESLHGLGRIEEADRTFEKLIEEDPTAPWVRLGWASLYHYGPGKTLADLEKAEEIYAKALEEIDDEKPELRQRLKEIAALKKNF